MFNVIYQNAFKLVLYFICYIHLIASLPLFAKAWPQTANNSKSTLYRWQLTILTLFGIIIRYMPPPFKTISNYPFPHCLNTFIFSPQFTLIMYNPFILEYSVDWLDTDDSLYTAGTQIYDFDFGRSKPIWFISKSYIF